MIPKYIFNNWKSENITKVIDCADQARYDEINLQMNKKHFNELFQWFIEKFGRNYDSLTFEHEFKFSINGHRVRITTYNFNPPFTKEQIKIMQKPSYGSK